MLQPAEITAPAAAPPPPAVMTTFHIGSQTHFVAVFLCLMVMTAVVLMARRLLPADRESIRRRGMLIDAPGRLLGLLSLTVWISHQIWWNIPADFDAAQSLPLHLCDLAAPIGALALLTGSRVLTSCIYFWGFALCTQAFATPVVKPGPLYTEFWLFFESHTIIIGSAVYVVAVRAFRPGWADYKSASLCVLLYFVLILPLDIAMNWNYGYVGKVAAEGTVITKLGPWPWRLFSLAALVFVGFFIVWLPWLIARAISGKKASA